MCADDSLLQMHFDDPEKLHEALQVCDLLLDQLVELGFNGNPTNSAMLLQMHGESAQQTREKLTFRKDGPLSREKANGMQGMIPAPGPNRSPATAGRQQLLPAFSRKNGY